METWKPEICIGIPTLNGSERLARTLDSIRKHTPLSTMKAKVFVSDDCSFEQNIESNKRICMNFGIEMLTAPNRYGVAAQWNRLTRHTEASVVILMNDDVEVVEDWLEVLAFTIRNNPHVGMAGLKAFEGVNSMNFTPPLPHSYNEAVLERGQSMLSSSGFIFAFSREKFDAVGGFDENFFCFYEEVDFGVRLLEKGYPSYMLSHPIVVHQGGATTSDRRNVDARRVMDESRDKFMAKYGSIRQLRERLVSAEAEKSFQKSHVQWNTMLKTLSD